MEDNGLEYSKLTEITNLTNEKLWYAIFYLLDNLFLNLEINESGKMNFFVAEET